jgi:hypothetical protein
MPKLRVDRPVNPWIGQLVENWNAGNLQALASRRPKSNDERPLCGRKIKKTEFSYPEIRSDVRVQMRS